MSDDKNDKHNQLDLGLTQILEALSTDQTELPRNQISEPSVDLEELDPKVNALAESLSNQSLPVVLLVPQLLELFYGTPLTTNASRIKSVECAVDVTKLLLEQEESLLADSVLSAIKNENLSSFQIAELQSALNKFLELNSTSGASGFTSEDPKILNARLSLLEFSRGFRSKSEEDSAINTVEPSNFEFAHTADRPKLKKSEPPINKWIIYILIGAILVATYSIFLNHSVDEYEMADSAYSKNSKTSGYGALVNDLSVQRQDVSNLSALMYDVSRDPPTPIPKSAPNTPQAQSVLPQQVNKSKAPLDMSGPIEPDRVKELMDRRDSSVYERPIERLNRRPLLTDDDLPSERLRPSPRRSRSDNDDRPGRFQTGQRYEVMINTSVMDAPSFNAKEVEELYVGDRIRVEARLGRWLKIRSRDGNPGYLLAGDAEKLFD